MHLSNAYSKSTQELGLWPSCVCFSPTCSTKNNVIFQSGLLTTLRGHVTECVRHQNEKRGPETSHSDAGVHRRGVSERREQRTEAPGRPSEAQGSDRVLSGYPQNEPHSRTHPSSPVGTSVSPKDAG